MARRAAVAGSVGTFVEYYDYGLFGVLTVYLAPLFFPTDNPASSILVSLAVFGLGYAARPIGGLVIGRLGDRRGRRAALLTSVLLMGVATSLIGVLPTYASAGITASILLVVLRLVQGFSAGAEVLGSVTYVLESAPPSRRGFLASLTPLGSTLGGATGALLGGLTSLLVSKATMLDYGWRIPFLIAIPLSLFAFLFRRKIEDSPEFLELVARKETAKTPIRDLFRHHRAPVLLACTLALGLNAVSGIAGWMTTYLAATRQLPVTPIIFAFGLATLLAAVGSPITGRLTDRFGGVRVMVVTFVGFLVLSVPIFWVLGTATNIVVLFLVIALYLMLIAFVTAPAYAYIAELFSTDVRFSGSNLGQNVGVCIAGGTTPLIAGALVVGTGSALSPVIWVGAATLVALGTLFVASRTVKKKAPAREEEAEVQAQTA
ncbi:glycine betaine/L-proline transporter ProP [Pseudonocardia ailaonensis]|uniref:Glycine betaine/L-proline transporter ProP n=1 Tax=Pseudonocardia ailaonensis TaxID=367279 RepID=A0ABN2N940_9PSEU